MSEKELEEILPCGDWLMSYTNSLGERSYWLRGGNEDVPIWSPSRVHRVALQAAILMEDRYKYEESIEVTQPTDKDIT